MTPQRWSGIYPSTWFIWSDAPRTDYRRPLDTFADTISAVVGLHFYLAGE